MRVGIGYDIHRLAPGRRLVLGGVEFPGPVGLAGHSDADAVMHAIADAILGAAALGDLGDHFPDDSPQWEGADSRDLLRAAADSALTQRAMRPHNVDVNIIAQAPRLKDKKFQMRRNIAAVLGLPVERVSVKARTAEGLGPVGRQEAIEVQAVVLMHEEGE